MKILYYLYNRYQEFRFLRREIIATFPYLSNLPFPKKQWFFNLSESVIQQRRIGLGQYLNELISLDPQPLELGIMNILRNTLVLTSSRML